MVSLVLQRFIGPPNRAVCLHSPIIDGQASSTRPSAAQNRTPEDSWRMPNFSLGSTRRRGRGNEYSPFPSASNNVPAAIPSSQASSTRDTELLGARQQLPHPSSSRLPALPPSPAANAFSQAGENGGGSCMPREADGAVLSSGGSASTLRPNSQPLLVPELSSRLQVSRSCSSLDDHQVLAPPADSITNTATTTTTATSALGGGLAVPGAGDGSGAGLEPRRRQQNGGSHSTPCSPTATQSQRSYTYLYLYHRLPKVTSDVDFERLSRNMHELQEGCFYYEGLDSVGARELLQHSPEGTFLVRESSDPNFLFAITVKTSRGATSVRIRYHHGFFQLDCEDEMRRKLPRFETMLTLLDFHVAVCHEQHGSQYRWLESSRRKDMVVRLSAPLRHSPPSLSHLARVTVNRRLEDLHLPSRSTDLLPLPPGMKAYLRAYAFKI